MGTMDTMRDRRRSGLFAWFADRAATRRSRHALMGLDDAMLRDIGLTRAEANREANRSFWS